MVDGRIVTVDLTNNLKILEELNIEVPKDIKSAGLIIINYSEEFMLECTTQGINLKFFGDMFNALRLFKDMDLVLVAKYSITGVLVINRLMDILKFHSIKAGPFIDNFIMFSNIPINGLPVKKNAVLALRSNMHLLTLHKLHDENKPVVDIVNEYMRYLGEDTPTFTNKENCSLEKMNEFLSDMSSAIWLNMPKDYSKYSFNEWYLKKLAKEEV